MKKTVQKTMMSMLGLLFFVNATIWSSYYYGSRPGNYVLLGVFFLLSITFNNIATNKNSPGLKNLLIIINLIIGLTIPFFYGAPFFTLYLFASVLLSGYFIRIDTSLKSIALIILTISLASLFSYFIPIRYILPLNILILICGGASINYRKLTFKIGGVYLLILIIGMINFIGLIDKEFFEKEAQFKGEIVMRKPIEENVYTLTQSKDDWILFENKKPIQSSADDFMLFESIIYSAFQYQPNAQKILIAGPRSIFFRENLNQFLDRNIVYVNQEKAKSQLYQSILRNGKNDHDELNSIVEAKQKFDIIILDLKDKPEDFLALLDKNGVLLKISSSVEELPDLDNFFKKDFHVALPTTGEHFWRVYSKDVLPSTPSKDIRYNSTSWYDAEAMNLISNFGKRY